jgi:hypothetical protein
LISDRSMRGQERRAEPYQGGASWLLSIVLPLVFGLGFLMLGFGLGSACTDEPGNGGLSVPPCNRIAWAVKWNLFLQVAMWVIALIHTVRSGTSGAVTRSIAVLSIVVFVGAVVLAASY